MDYSKMIRDALAGETSRMAGGWKADDMYGAHLEAGGWIPVHGWRVSGLPYKVVRQWRAALMLSGALASGQIYLKDNGEAGGMTTMGLFRHAMRLLGGALALKSPGMAVIVPTTTHAITKDGFFPGNGVEGSTFIVGSRDISVLKVGSGENPFIAMRRAIEEACGPQAALKLCREAEGIPDHVMNGWLNFKKEPRPEPKKAGKKKASCDEACDPPVELVRKWLGIDDGWKAKEAV